MNRNFLLIAIAAIAIAGIGVGLLLPNLQGGPLAGSIAPNVTTLHPLTMTPVFNFTPTPVPPVIRISGTYSPYLQWNDRLDLDEWHWQLHNVITYDATSLPAGILVQRIDWTIVAAKRNGGTELCLSRYMERSPPYSEISLTDTITTDVGDTWIGCGNYGSPLCPADEWIIRPPFTASCTITTTDGSTYTKSVELSRK